jgi:hypothetical protein
MAENTMRKIKWFFPWQDEQEEAWLTSMSKKGWHLVSVGLPCTYRFRTGESRDYVYRLDYQTFPKKDKQEYQQLFRDAGWEYIGEMSAWQYFRKEVKEEEPLEIFTDVESKIAKYKRMLAFLWLFWVVLVVVIPVRGISIDDPYPWWGAIQAIQVFTLLIWLFFTYVIIRLSLRIRQLKRI